MKYSFGLLLVIFFSAFSQIPQNYGDINLLTGASNPAVALIGSDARLIAYPSDPADITFCLIQLADSLDKGPGTFSLEVAPYWLTPASDELGYMDFLKDGGPLTAVLQTLTFSLAISNEIKAPTGGTGIALGVQTSLIRPSTDDVDRLESLYVMHDTLSLNALELLVSLRKQDDIYTALKLRLYSNDLIEDEREDILNQLGERDSILMEQVRADLMSQINAAREFAESFGLVRRGVYLDIAGGIVEFFEGDDVYSNRVYRYGCWGTGGFLSPPWTFNAIAKYQGYMEGDIDYQLDTGIATSVNISHRMELSGEYIWRNSRMTNGQSETTNRMDLAITIPFIRNTTVTLTLGKDFGADGQGNLITKVNVIFFC